MYSTTNPKGQGLKTPTDIVIADGENKGDAQKRYRIEAVIWSIGLLLFIISCFVIHFHPQPYPIDLTTTYAVQSLHLWPWLSTLLILPSIYNNPIPAAISIATLFVAMLAVGLIRLVRKLPAANWLISAAFLVLTVMSSAGLNVIIDMLVGRPRPDPKVYHIHLYTPLVPFPTYPSGHTEHDVALYGFLLYLTLTKAVREWKYHWILLPFQIFVIYDLLAIGYSRILEGDHWLTDVLGGYLEGALYLFFFIFLYRLTVAWYAGHRAKKLTKLFKGEI